MDIKDYMIKYWIKKTIKKWEYLFKSNEKDTNLYYVIKWWILLSLNWNNIALTWNDEILWEKSFIELSPKPIDAIAKIDTEYLVMINKDFENIDDKNKLEFIKKLVLFISNRVYLLNDIVKNVSSISLKILDSLNDITFSTIQEIFTWLFKLDDLYVYKYINWWILEIFQSSFDIEIPKYVNIYNRDTKNDFYFLWNNLYLIKTWDFCFIIKWEIISSEYVVNNVILNSIASFNHLWVLLEKQKEESLQDFLE